jgi:copper resistance protein C
MTRRAALTMGLLLLVPAVASAHAVLVKSAPASRAVLMLPPSHVELTFNERLEPAYSTVSVWAAGDQRVDDGKIAITADNPRRVSVGVPSLKQGSYTVKYRVLSVDGHLVEGTFPFEIRPRP